MPKTQKARGSSNSRSAANYAESIQATSQPRSPQVPTPLDSLTNFSPTHDSYALPEVPQNNDVLNARVKSYSSTRPLTDGSPVVAKEADHQQREDRTPQPLASRSIKPDANEVASGSPSRASSSAFVPRNLRPRLASRWRGHSLL